MNYLEFEMPSDAIQDCFHQGGGDLDVEFWQKELNLNLNRSCMIKELSEFGAWSNSELNELSDAELEHTIIWIGAGNIQDDPEHEFNLNINGD